MKKVLYIDIESPVGHINLNKKYINCLLKNKCEISLVLKEGYMLNLSLSDDLLRLSIPHHLYRFSSGKIMARLSHLRILFFIKKKINIKEYDYIFFSTYEEISLYFSGIKGNLILLNHSNAADLDNSIKRFFIKKVSRKSIHIVFAQFIANQFKKYNILNTMVEPLGLSEPYKIEKFDQPLNFDIIEDFERIIGHNHLIFVPSGSKFSDTFIHELIKHETFIKFIENNKILLVVKGNGLISFSKNILISEERISTHQYQYLFLKSSLILINYPESFRYRVSAILFECFSNNKKCLLSNIESFRAFENHFNYDPYFKNTDELIERIKNILLEKPKKFIVPYNNLEELNPSFESFFHK